MGAPEPREYASGAEGEYGDDDIDYDNVHHLDDHRRDDNAAATLRYNQPLFEHRYG